MLQKNKPADTFDLILDEVNVNKVVSNAGVLGPSLFKFKKTKLAKSKNLGKFKNHTNVKTKGFLTFEARIIFT